MPLMTLLPIILILIAWGVGLWALNKVPMQNDVKNLINIVVILALILWLLKVFGVWNYLLHFKV